MECQQRLLRVLNDGIYTRVGDTTPLRSVFQVITASTRDLDDAVEGNEFLLDLRMRIMGVDIHLAPLRERLDEIGTLVRLYFAKNPDINIAPAEMLLLIERCKQFYWRGNIRQLYKVLNALVVTCQFNDHQIEAKRLPVYKTMLPPQSDGALNPSQELITDEPFQILRSALLQDVALEESMTGIEKAIIASTLQRHSRRTDACAALKISRSTLDQKRRAHGLE